MSLITLSKIGNHTQIVIWRMDEDFPLLKDLTASSDEEKLKISTLTEKQQRERFSALYVIQSLTGKKYYKDVHGKPYLEDSKSAISVSHSHNFLAVSVSEHLVGIDIQYQTPRLKKIAVRVMNEEKLSQLDASDELLHLHIYWGAKEALFKAYGEHGLHFKNNILIKPFLKLPDNPHVLQKVTTGTVSKNDYLKNFQIFFQLINDYVLIVALENSAS